jgi:hypothetical protein
MVPQFQEKPMPALNTDNSPTAISTHDWERMISNAVWSFGVEGIEITREEAEESLRRALSKPLPEI